MNQREFRATMRQEGEREQRELREGGRTESSRGNAKLTLLHLFRFSSFYIYFISHVRENWARAKWAFALLRIGNRALATITGSFALRMLEAGQLRVIRQC
jgi:hypothetical protein